ncbi:MAG TPA: hypothetical protein V6D03_07020 [Candidatus Caenarcaniphilales bacterium]
MGTLVWWLSQEAESLSRKQERSGILPPQGIISKTRSPRNCYIIFLPGVGDFSADQLTPGEAVFMDRLVQAHLNCVAVRDIFPYSAANESLGGERLLAPLWRFAEEAEGWLAIADTLIKVRNLWRFAISADPRYGPIYNQGTATAILEHMEAKPPIPLNSHQPTQIILLGTSGGVQMALGAATYLQEWLDARIIVLSIGGVFAGTNGFDAVERVYHLQGRQDWIEDLGVILFPARRPWARNSPFNQARLQGRYIVQSSGPHAHDGAQGYFGENLVTARGISYVDLTLTRINQLPIWPGTQHPDTQENP